MEKINDIINSEVTMSEENDSLENSVKADSEESEIFENSKAEMGDFFMNSDEKTDNEVTKNHGQLSGKQQGCQEKLKAHLAEEQNKMSRKEGIDAENSTVEQQEKLKISLTEEQKEMSIKKDLDINQSTVEQNKLKIHLTEEQKKMSRKEGIDAEDPTVEQQEKLKISLAEEQKEMSIKEDLDINQSTVEQTIGKTNPIHQQEAREEIEEVGKDVKCICKKHCNSPELNMKEPRLIFRLLTKGEEDIPHTIKWLEDIHRNVERDWFKSMKKYQNEPPDKRSEDWRWLQDIKKPTKHKRELDEALIKRLPGIANSEAETIKNWCVRIKMLFTNIRATFKQLEPDHLETLIYDNGNPEIKFEGKMGRKKKLWLLMSQKRRL